MGPCFYESDAQMSDSMEVVAILSELIRDF